MSKNQVDAYVKFGEKASNYGRQYEDADFAEFYPEHRYRLRIFMQLLKSIGPEKILDVGCGSGEPLVTMLEEGLDVVGFDYSMEMGVVVEGRAAASVADVVDSVIAAAEIWL